MSNVKYQISNNWKSGICKEAGYAPLFLLVFAGAFMLFSIFFMDRYWLKNPNSTKFIAQQKPNPVITSANTPELDPDCEENEDDVGCLGEGEDIKPNPAQLASAE